jgi:hypothetical protein
MNETSWENNLNFAKDVPKMSVNLITIVIVVSEKQIGGITFIPTFVLTYANRTATRCSY